MNDHIAEYCINNYIKADINPDYAILIKGKWGCGKTYFVKNSLLKEAFGEEYKNQTIWVSVYGINSIPQLQQKLFDCAHKILGNKITKLVLGVAEKAIGYSAGFDFNNDGANDLSINLVLSDIISDDEKKIKNKKLFIIDDIERCSIRSEELLGFFSDYITEEHFKIIFIGNTDKIENIDKFKEIKEKIIGIEFEIQPEIDNAIDSFIKELNLSEYEQIIKKSIGNVIKILKIENLRSIRQALVHIREIISILKEIDNKEALNENYISKLVEVFFVVFLQKCIGKTSDSDTDKTLFAYFNRNKSVEQFNQELEQKDNKDILTDLMYVGYSLRSNLPLAEELSNIVFKGEYNIKKIEDDYRAKTHIVDNRTALQKLIQEWWTYSDGEFRNLYNEILGKFKNNEILSPSVLMTFLMLEIHLVANKITTFSYEETERKFEEYIKANGKKFSIEKNIGNYHYNIYLDVDKADFDLKEKLLKNINDMLVENNDDLLKEQLAHGFVNLFDSDFDLFLRNIYVINGEHIYDEFPILSIIDIDNLFKKLQMKSYEDQLAVCSAFENRYEKIYSNGVLKEKYFPDIEKIKQISEFYTESIVSLTNSPESFRKNVLATKYRDLYKWMKSSQKKNRR